MGLFSSKTVKTVIKKPVTRLFKSCFQPMGAIKREPDTRTVQELVQTIEAYAQQIPEVKAFAGEIKYLKPKHMATIADTIELSQHYEMLPTNIDLRMLDKSGLSIREILIKDMVEASKTNPEAMELVDAIINNTDTTTAKYALACMRAGVLRNKDLAAHMSEAAKVIPDVAEQTLNGGYTMDFSKQEKFMNMIKTFVNPNAKPEKITALFTDLAPAIDKLEANFNIYMDKFVNSSTPLEKVKENIKVLPDIVKMLGEKVKDFNVVDFVTKNTNLY